MKPREKVLEDFVTRVKREVGSATYLTRSEALELMDAIVLTQGIISDFVNLSTIELRADERREKLNDIISRTFHPN